MEPAARDSSTLAPSLSTLRDFPVPSRLHLSTGWDSNPRAAAPSTGAPGVPQNGQGSGFWQNDFALRYPMGHGRSRFNLDANYSNTWNSILRREPAVPEHRRVPCGYFRQINQRWSLGDAIHFTHQTEPDFSVGNTINRPTGGYYSGSNGLWVDFKWTNRFSICLLTPLIIYPTMISRSRKRIIPGIPFPRNSAIRSLRRPRSISNIVSALVVYPHNPEAESQSNYFLLGVDRPREISFHEC